MNEITRFQRLPASSAAASASQDGSDEPSSRDGAAGEAVEPRVGREPLARRARGGPARRRSRRRGRRRGPPSSCGSATLRARERPRGGAEVERPRGRGCEARSAATRSSAFWSTTTSRKRRWVCASSECEERLERRRSGRPSRRRGRSGGRERLPPPAQATLSRPWPRRSCPSSSPLATPRRRSGEAVAERPRPDGRRPRARRRRRRLRRRHRRRARRPSTTRGSASFGTSSRSGLAGALNVGLDAARGRYVARMDADDVALPGWLERVVGASARRPRGRGRRRRDDRPATPTERSGTVHRMPSAARAVRWARALLVAVLPPDRDRRPRGPRAARAPLRHRRSRESEDYDLWTRLLEVADGDNVREPLVLYRRHDAQASTRRGELQRECRRRVALRQIAAARAAARRGSDAELAWRVGRRPRASEGGRGRGGRRPPRARRGVRGAPRWRRGAPRRGAGRSPGAPDVAATRGALAARGAGARPDAPASTGADASARAGASARAERAAAARFGRRAADEPVRLTIVLPEPTPYRTGMLDRLARTARPRPDGRLRRGSRSSGGRGTSTLAPPRGLPRRPARAGRVRACSGTTTRSRSASSARCATPARTSSSSRAGARSPRRRRSPGAGGTASRTCCSSRANERDATARLAAAVKNAVVPTVVGGAAEVLVVGSLARESMRRARRPTRPHLGRRQHDRRRPASPRRRTRSRRGGTRSAPRRARGRRRRRALRRAARAREGARHAGARGRGRGRARGSWSSLAGSGPERERLASLAAELGVRLVLLPDIPWERIVERYVVADVFALLSRHEPWGVVVNEAAACGLPLVLSDRVGAAFDLLEDGGNGLLVPVDDVAAAARRAPRARRRSRAAPRDGRGLAGDRRRVGLRAEHRAPRRGRAPRRRPSARERLGVERELLVDDGVPGRAPRRPERSFREPPPQRGVPEDARDRVDGRVDVVGDDERLARLERRRDAAPVGDDDRRPDRRGLGCDEPEVLAARGEDEHVRPPVEVERRARRRRAGDARGRRSRGSACAASHERQRPVPVVRAGENDVDVREPARSLEEVLDALLGRDPADVEDDRRAVGNDARERIAVGRRRRLGEGVAADPDPATGRRPTRRRRPAPSATTRRRGARPPRRRASRRVEERASGPPSAAAARTSRPARRR